MERRFIVPVILSVLLLTLGVIFSFLPIMDGIERDIIPIYPGNGLTDIILTLIIPYSILIATLFLGPFFVILFFRLHKLVKLNKYDYYIVTNEKNLPSSRIILRSVFPGLLAVNVGIYFGLSSSLMSLVTHDPNNLFGAIEYASVIFGMPIAILLILPLWMLESSGLICKKRIEEYNRPVSPDIEGVGLFYKQMIKGYVGISTIISYTTIIITIYQTGGTELFLLFIDPLLVIFLMLPGSLLVELRANKTNKQLLSYYEKVQIDINPKTIKIE